MAPNTPLYSTESLFVDVMTGLRSPNLPVYDQIIVDGGFVADGTVPGRLPLVHLEEKGGVEALQVLTGGGAAGRHHFHLAEGAHQRHAQRSRRDLAISVLAKFLLDWNRRQLSHVKHSETWSSPTSVTLNFCGQNMFASSKNCFQ